MDFSDFSLYSDCCGEVSWCESENLKSLSSHRTSLQLKNWSRFIFQFISCRNHLFSVWCQELLSVSPQTRQVFWRKQSHYSLDQSLWPGPVLDYREGGSSARWFNCSESESPQRGMSIEMHRFQIPFIDLDHPRFYANSRESGLFVDKDETIWKQCETSHLGIGASLQMIPLQIYQSPGDKNNPNTYVWWSCELWDQSEHTKVNVPQHVSLSRYHRVSFKIHNWEHSYFQQ